MRGRLRSVAISLMVIETRPDWNDLLWRLAQVTAALHEGTGDRSALLVEKAELWREAERIGLFHPRFRAPAARPPE